jgi:hypothetical protein
MSKIRPATTLGPKNLVKTTVFSNPKIQIPRKTNTSMSTATTTSHDTGQQTSPRGLQREAQQPVMQQERSAADRLRTTMAAQNVLPVAVTAGDKIESLRQWASGRCLSADRAGVYSRGEMSSGGGRVRRVVRAD